MNASHARPLLAFCALAVGAAVITATGLGAGIRDVTVHAGTSSPVQTSGAPELVLGRLLRADNPGVPAKPLASRLWSSLAGAVTPGNGVQVVTPDGGRPKARPHSTGEAQPVTVPTDSSSVTTAQGARGAKPHKDPPGRTKTTTTATARTSDTHGKGPGSDHPGNGSGH